MAEDQNTLAVAIFRLFRRAGIFFLGIVLLEVFIVWHLRDEIRTGQPDFTIFYTAAKIVAEGKSHALYDTSLQRAVQASISPLLGGQPWALPFNHPPFEALLFWPLARLPYTEAYLVWAAVNLLLVMLTIALLRRYIAQMQQAPYLFWLLGALAFFPIFVALLQGQDSLLLLALFSLGYVAFRVGKPFQAGCWLGLGLFRFHLVLPVALILLFSRKWKALAAIASVALILAGISVMMVGVRQTLDYPFWLWHLERSIGSSARLLSAMPSLRGMLRVILGQNLSAAADGFATVTGIFLLLWVVTKCRFGGTEGEFDLSFALAIVATIVTGYHVLPHDLSLLFLAALLVANRVPEVSPRAFRLSLLGPLFVLFCGPVQMLLWFRGKHFDLFAPVLLLWLGAIGGVIGKEARLNKSGSAATSSS